MPRNARKFTIFDEVETSRRGPVALLLGSLAITLIAVPGPVYAQSVCDMPPVGSGTATAANSIGEMAASTGERSVVCRKNLGAVPDTAGFWRRALGAITAVLVVVMIVAGVIVLPEAAYAETCLLDSGSGSAPVSNSFACGNSASASAPNSTAVGNHTDAAGAYSVAVGFLSNASQSHAVAVGATSNASGTEFDGGGLRQRGDSIAGFRLRLLQQRNRPASLGFRWFEHGERDTVLGLRSLKHSKRRRHRRHRLRRDRKW